jgi:hypothetical protein
LITLTANWDDFRCLVNEKLTSNFSLETEEAAVKFFNDTVQWTGWNTTPEHIKTLKGHD